MKEINTNNIDPWEVIDYWEMGDLIYTFSKKNEFLWKGILFFKEKKHNDAYYMKFYYISCEHIPSLSGKIVDRFIHRHFFSKVENISDHQYRVISSIKE